MKNKSLDGLRGLAALNVCTSHFVAAFMPSALKNVYPEFFSDSPCVTLIEKVITGPFLSIFYNGQFAVIIFFVLSGYVLTSPASVADGTLKLKARLTGRFVRLNFPIFVAVLISFVLFKLGFYFNNAASVISGSQWLGGYFEGPYNLKDSLKKAIYGTLILGNASLVPPSWSLSAEFFGSIYILLFYIIDPAKKLCAFGACTIMIYLVYRNESLFYIAFFVGSTFNFFSMKNKMLWPIFFTGLYFGAFQVNSYIHDFLPAIRIGGYHIFRQRDFYNFIGASFLVFSVVNGSFSYLFTNKFSQFLGKISFSLYIVHFLVLCSFISFIYSFMPINSLSIVLLFATYVIICFAISKLYEQYIDRTAIVLGHKFSNFLLSR